MFDIENEIKKWRKSLLRTGYIEDSDITELESHLRDEIDYQVSKGLNEKNAFIAALEKSAHADILNAEFHKVRRLSNIHPFWHPSRFMPSLIWNYIKITLRKIRLQKGFSLINITGLAVGMAACILILIWVQDELSYDKFHKNGNQIYRINTEDLSGGQIFAQAGSPAPLGQAMLEEVPEVLNFVRIQAGWSSWNLHLGDTNFLEEPLAAVDPSFFEIFKFPFIKGDPKSALKDRYSIVITKKLGNKIFGEEDPMGKTLSVNDADMKVTGVIEDIPRNSHIQFTYAFPSINMTEWRESKLDKWTYTQFATYVLLREDAKAKAVNDKMMTLVKKHFPKANARVYLQPLKDIHLHSKNINTWMLVYPNKGTISFIYIFSLTAFCILLLACINFMNLSTAHYSTRAKEVGLRKVVGARKIDLIRQFLGESTLMTFVSLLAAIALVELSLPVFSNLSGKKLVFIQSGNWMILIGLFVLAMVASLVAGSYPAIFLSSFQPVKVIKDGGKLGSARGGTMRKVLVVLQFTFMIGLIITSSVIYLQLRFMQNRDLGYDSTNIISFAAYNQYRTNYEAAKSELLQNPNVLAVCRGFPPRGNAWGTTHVDWEGKDPSLEIKIAEGSCSPDYIKVFNMKMKEGRFFSQEFSGDNENWVLNETAIKAMQLEDPVGKWFSYKGRKGTIIGIINDFHGESLHNPIAPVAMHTADGFLMMIKYRTGNLSELIKFFKEKWDKFVGNKIPFRYGFIDETIDKWYNTERRVGKIFKYFTGLTIFIASLGLFGLAAFMAEQRTKEIGIRKVLGAKVSAILILLTKEFAKWVLLANLVSWPLAYFIVKKWLTGFSYRINIGLEIFIFSALLTLLIAVLTVSYQSIRAATCNPIESLRYE